MGVVTGRRSVVLYLSLFSPATSMDVEHKLSSEGYEVQSYIRNVAREMDSSMEVKKHKRTIQEVAEQTAQELKQNVYQNYALFINTSKEISSLEAEMYQLSHMLNEHESLTRDLSNVALSVAEAEVGDTGADPEKYSIASLLETVEGCSSVTEVPGRFLVYFSSLTELHQETSEEVQLVQAFLLNDSLMVASHTRRRKGPVRYRFQALYELDNMAVVEVKDTESVRNAFKILMFPDSHLYQAESYELKKMWIELLEDTKQKHKISRDALKREMSVRSQFQHEQKTSAKLGAPSSSLQHAQKSSSFPNPGSHFDPPSFPPREQLRQSRLMSQQTPDSEHRRAVDWLKDAPEILDVCIAQRDVDNAMKLIDDAKCLLKDFSDSHALRDVRARINHRITQLSTVLMKELESSPSGSLRGGPRAARRAVELLIKLGHATKACQLFLLNHQCIIRRDLDDVKNEEGANVLYVGNMANVFFSGLMNAATEFQRAFCSNNGSYSSFVVWCINELQAFCHRCESAIFKNMTLASVTDCLAAIRKECDGLNAIGLELSFKVMHNFNVQILEALSNEKEEIVNQCSLSATPEKWEPLNLENDPPRLAAIIMRMENLGVEDFQNKIHGGGVIDLSHTTITFCQLLFNFVDDVKRLYMPEFLISIFECFCDIFEHVVDLYVDAFVRDENIAVGKFIVADAQFVVETLLPSVGESMNEWTNVQIPEFIDLQNRLVLKVAGCASNDKDQSKGDGDSEDSVA